MTHGILYLVWGNYNKAQLNRSIKSVEAHGYNYHVEIVEDQGIGLAHKSLLAGKSPFDITCYLDTDTQVVGSLDYAFDTMYLWCKDVRIACCIAPAGSVHLAGKEVGMNMPDGMPQYNTGVIFYDNRSLTNSVLQQWANICTQYPMSSKNDQPAFTLALHKMNILPYVLGREWNFRKKVRYEGLAHGQIKILHQK